MENPLKNKCPVCRSADLSNPVSWMPPLYTMKPITCNSCNANFEPNIINRVGLWAFITGLFCFVFSKNKIIGTFGKDFAMVTILAFLGAFFLLAIIGAILEVQRPWQFTLWNEKNRSREIVNYGTLASFLVYAIIYYAQ